MSHGRPVLQVAKLSLSVARRCVSAYGSIKSRHDFTQPQLVACLVLRAYTRSTFRGVVALLAEMPDVREALGLEHLPHYTTLQKFSRRPGVVAVVESMIAEVLRGVTGQMRAPIDEAAMDSTGLAMTSASAYFRMRAGRDEAKKKAKAKRSGKPAVGRKGQYVKVSVCVGCATLLPCAVRVGFGPRPDTMETAGLLEQTVRVVRPARLYADAGFDAESLHVACREEHGIESWVPPVIRTRDGSVKTPYRALMLNLPPEYGRRWQVESYFSGLKRKTGGSLATRHPQAMLNEAALRVLAYAIDR